MVNSIYVPRQFTHLSMIVVLAMAISCAPPPDKITLLAMDLIPCLGHIDTPQPRPDSAIIPVESTCRGALDSQLDQNSQVNVCLLVRLSDSENYATGFRWSDGRLGRPQGNLDVEPGRRMSAALVFLSEGGKASVCNDLKALTLCEDTPNCVLRLYQETVIPGAGDGDLITFTRNIERQGDAGLVQVTECQPDRSARVFDSVPDVCDNKDNDCDGLVDENFGIAIIGNQGIYKNKPCSIGTGACRVEGGTYQCANENNLHCVAQYEGRSITIQPTPPFEEDRCDEAGGDETDGVGTNVDDDCDGEIDERLPCFSCKNTDGIDDDSLCADFPGFPFCLDGNCHPCRFASEGHDGCGADELCCKGGDARPLCVPTSDGQCTACGEVGACDVGDDSGARTCNDTRQCVCSGNFGAACAIDGGTPLCAEDGVCVQCVSSNDCPNDQLCCGRQCVPTDPSTQCTDCDVPCSAAGANGCVDRACLCADETDCGAETCDENGDCTPSVAPYCLPDSTERHCHECRFHEDCIGIGNATVCKEPSSEFDIRTCIECLENTHCPRKPNCIDDPNTPNKCATFCVAEKCEPCDLDGGSSGCVGSSSTPKCQRDDNGDVACVGCTDNNDCLQDLDVSVTDPFEDLGDLQLRLRFCNDETGACTVCDRRADNFNAGCGDSSRPICTDVKDGLLANGENRDGRNLENFGCRECQNNAECGGDRICNQGRCEGCNAQTNSGCQLNQPNPICSDEGFCRGCEIDAECAGNVPSEAEILADPALENYRDRVLCVNVNGGANEGRCQQCDPRNHNGCDQNEQRLVCGNNGFCAPCQSDANCTEAYIDRSQCVAENCERCDPADNSGCQDPLAPVCSANLSCTACRSDDECRAGLVGAERDTVFCDVRLGICAQCETDSNDGCDHQGDRPICSVDNQCRGCNENAPISECDANEFCVQGDCHLCDPRNHQGCDEDAALPICGADASICRGCNNDDECSLRPGDQNICVAGFCLGCAQADNRGCEENADQPVCGPASECIGCLNNDQCRRGIANVEIANTIYCDPNSGRCGGCEIGTNVGCVADGARPICSQDNQCRECGDDGECAGPALCVAGRCQGCDANGHRGCAENSLTPICQLGSRVCEGCQSDLECQLRPGQLDVCIAGIGQCHFCDPATHRGCENTPLTPTCDPVARTCRSCQNDNDCPGQTCDIPSGQCGGCEIGTNDGCIAAGDRPICGDDNQCRGCQENVQVNECPADEFCVQGRCRTCDSRDQRGCNEEGPTPICGPATGECRRCLNEGECIVRSGSRDACVNGACYICDQSDNNGCGENPEQPVCGIANVCVGCQNNQQCRRGLPPEQADIIVCDPASGRCAGCEVGTNNGCRPEGATPICGNDNRCRECTDDNECPGENLCVLGRCQECDARDHRGCSESSVQPICGAEGQCIRCESDLLCLIRAGESNVCVVVDGRCRECDPEAQRGCEGTPDRPTCDAATFTCRTCAADADCPGTICDIFSGVCAQCQPAVAANAQRGCDPTSGQPICNAATRTCEGCANDGECTVQGQNFCFRGFCSECDPSAGRGCNSDPDSLEPICQSRGECGPCEGRAECILQGAPEQECVNGSCVQCNSATNEGCIDPNAPICGNNAVCRGCQVGECLGEDAICFNGQCVGCDPGNPDTCPDGQPICDNAGRQCRACVDSNECPSECVGGRCEACDPLTNTGCDSLSASPICGANNVCDPCAENAQCEILGIGRAYCAGGRCRVCDPGDNSTCPNPRNPICGPGGSCVACDNADNLCDAGLFCNNGRCRPCESAIGSPDSGCSPQSPICDGGDFLCRGCNNDQECDGEQCVGGRCETCDPTDHQGCNDPTRPLCNPVTKSCRICQVNAECELRDPNNPICDLVTGGCVKCTADGNQGCGEQTPICNQDANICEGCVGAGEGNCAPGTQCVGGSCQGCNPATNAGCNQNAPVCNAVDFTCDPCRFDVDCPGGICVGGECLGCNPANNAGCLAGSQLCCTQNQVAVCVDLAPDGACLDCDTGCGTSGNACANQQCACGEQPPCANALPFCIGDGANSICSECRSNDDCLAGSGRPFCDLALGQCEACNGDSNRCNGNPNGALCVTEGVLTGSCRLCDPGTSNGQNGCNAESTRPICQSINNDTETACIRCTNAPPDACVGNPNGPACKSGAPSRGSCVICDPQADPGSSCNLNSTSPQCGPGSTCIACANNAFCTGNDQGELCTGTGACGCADFDDCNNGQVCDADLCRACDPALDPSECPQDLNCIMGSCQ